MRQRMTVIFLVATLFLAACGKKESTSSGTTGDQTSAAPGQQSAPETASTPEPGTATPTPAQQAMAPATAPKPLVLPAGTVITVRLNQAVGSKTSQAGEEFTASVSAPVSRGEKVVIPSGADASGVVTEAHPAGRFKGGATLGLELNSITINGRPHKVQTTVVAQTSTGKGKRTAGMVGGGAAGGALIGGLAGGGKGAAIGALVGAGAGTAGAGLTGNRDISLPAESMLSFKLTEPLKIQPK